MSSRAGEETERAQGQGKRSKKKEKKNYLWREKCTLCFAAVEWGRKKEIQKKKNKKRRGGGGKQAGCPAPFPRIGKMKPEEGRKTQKT